MVKSSSQKTSQAEPVASEQPQNQQCGDEHKQLSAIVPSEIETKLEDAGKKIGIVKAPKKRKSKKKVSEQLQILQSIDALEQISSVGPCQIEINSGDAEGKIECVELTKTSQAAPVVSEQPQNQQCSDEHKQLSAIVPSEIETKLEDAGKTIGIVKAPKKRKSKKKKVSEQLQILQSVDALEQISSVGPCQIEINHGDAEGKIECVELTKTSQAAPVVSEQPQNQQCGDEHKQLSAIVPSELETKLEDAGKKIGIVKAPKKRKSNKKKKKVSEQLLILQSVDALEQISSVGPCQMEINPGDAVGKIECVELTNMKIPEQPQIVQSGDEHKHISSVSSTEIGISPEDVERKTESVEPPNKNIPQQPQSGDEQLQLSFVLPSEIETKPEDAKGKIESVEPPKEKKKKKKKEEEEEEGSNTTNSKEKTKKKKEGSNTTHSKEKNKKKKKVGGDTDNSKKDVSQDTKDRILQQLNLFLASSAQEYTFEENLEGNKGRALVHNLCKANKKNIVSKSKGKGLNRRVVVYKINNNCSTRAEVWKDPPSFLKFSEESKEVLRNLFMKYPPGQDEHIQIKSDCCSSMNKKIRNQLDDFFCKPRMNRVEIAKKVEALSSKIKRWSHLEKINEQRSRLPITSSRDVILSKVECNQVVLISGETGCGKTTQVPQFLLDKMWESGESCKIICTQPRRISATSVAERISQERGEVIGETVGYKIRLESQGGRDSSLVFCTNGVLLRLLVSDGLAGSNPGSSTAAASSYLSQITHIVVDEIHERDHFSDFMLAVLRDLLPRYPQLRLVLMSATMDAKRFSQYFGDCPTIQVPGFTYPVTSFYLEDIISILKSAGKNHTNATLPCSSSEQLELTDEHKLAFDEAIDLAWSKNEFDPLLELVSSEEKSKLLNYQHTRTGISPLMVFSAKGRVGDMCMLLSLGADCHLKGKDGSTALNWAKRANQTETADTIRRHLENASSNPIGNAEVFDKHLSSPNPDLIDTVHIEKLLLKICTDSDHGAILVFLAGWDDITKAQEKLLGNRFFQDSSKFQILPLHSMVPPDEQKKVFNRPPDGCRKIILSTNIAETSVTIDDVVYVIDTGRMKEKGYDSSTNVSTLQSSWVSKASVKQRAGRAGRCQPGFCYHLYSKIKAESFSEFSIPEIKRMPLDELCLQVKMLDPNYDIVEFLNKTLDPPLYETIRNAVTALKELGALSSDESLTKLGKQLGSLPVHPLTSKMLFFAILCNCLDPALTLACTAFYRDPFTISMIAEQKKKGADARAELAALYCGQSDQLAMVAAFECWKNLKDKGQQLKFCSKYFISSGTMTMLSGMRKQLQRELELIGYIPNDISTYNQNARDPGIVQAVLVAGLYPNVGRVRKKLNSTSNYLMETASGYRVRVTQSSNSLLPLKYYKGSALAVYGEISQGDGGLQVKKCSLIRNLPLALLAGEIAVAPSKDNGDGVMSSADNPVVVIVDRWLSFESTALEVAQIYCLRERLSSAILLKGTEPRDFLLSPALAATLDAVTCILSRDGHPKNLTFDTPQSSEGEKATDQGQSESEKIPSHPGDTPKSSVAKKATDPEPSEFLKNLFYQESADISHGSEKKARKMPSSSNGKKTPKPSNVKKAPGLAPNPFRIPMQQPSAVPTAPVSLNGYGSSLFGPYGPRGRSCKRSRSDR